MCKTHITVICLIALFGVSGCSSGGQSPNEIASLVDLPLLEAREKAKSAGFEIEEETDAAFGVWSPENYTVCDQRVDDGTVFLEVSKNCESWKANSSLPENTEEDRTAKQATRILKGRDLLDRYNVRSVEGNRVMLEISTDLYPKPANNHLIVGLCTSLYDLGIDTGSILVFNSMTGEAFDVDHCDSWHWE